MDSCIFCKIVRGEIPSYKVYEDRDTLAFLDINPVNLGHVLVIPKKHFENFQDIPSNVLCEIINIIKKLTLSIIQSVQAKDYNIMLSNGKIAGQEVPHAHFHIIPRFEKDAFEVHFNSKKISSDEMKKIAESIRKELSKLPNKV